MEPSQHGLLEEILLASRRENWTKFSNGVNDHHHQFFPSGWSYYNSLDNGLDLATSNISFPENITNAQLYNQTPSFPLPFNEIYPYCNGFTTMEIDSSSIKNDHIHPYPVHDGCVLGNDLYNLEEMYSCSSKEEKEQACLDNNNNVPVFHIGSTEDRRNKSKKVEGQPSKNLMAERRRRKRLNDRLSMLRSVVPKVSKMDRTSILADTIDYMKELLEKINKLKEKDAEVEINPMNLMQNLKELDMNEAVAKKTSKFHVERLDEKSTRIDISCAAKPGLLSSTVNTIEALGLDIQQCVISCFDDFSLQASCSEAMEHRTVISSEDLKHALYGNANHGGRCL